MTTVFDELLSTFKNFLAAFDREPVNSFAADIDWRMPERKLQSNSLACLAHLDRAQKIAGAQGKPLARLLDEHRGAFRWGQTYTQADFGRKFIDNYGWLEVFGTRGHFDNRKIAGGFLLLGPGIVYPDHHHVAEEIYIPLTGGADWRMGDGEFRRREAGEIIHHTSRMNHAMRTGEDPLLALYLWRGGPLAARSTVTGAAGQNGR
jgi:hypothetical protein